MVHIWYDSTRGDVVFIDITGVELTPGNNGENCKGNGKHIDENGTLIECCCDECNYLLCCTSYSVNCSECIYTDCPRKMES